MSIVQDYKNRVKAEKLKPSVTQHINQPSHVSPRVIELAEQIKAWHDTRPVPERWKPIQLGRLAAQFGVSRELLASALRYAGWIESREGNSSLWQPSNK